jgi:hypothetical protein
MSGNADTIKDFLVSLGFDIDNAGANKFEAVVKGVTANVLKLGATVEGAAASVLLFTTKIADGLDKLYWASQRTGATVAGIKALGYAASQTGGNAQAALSSLEGLASFMRNNPGAEGFLNRLGVQTRDARGKMRDTATIFTGVGQKLNSMPYYRARQYAQMLGIDENTLQSMRRGLGQFSSEYALTAKRIGFNAEDAAKKSNVFMTSMRNMTMTLGAASDKIGSNLAGGLAGSIDNLRKQLLDNWPKIEAVIMSVIKGVLWAGNAVTRVLWRTGQAVSGVMDWFKKLDPVTKQLIELFGGLLVIWRLLNTSFLMSPVGIIITLGAAIIALFDDYKTWQEGGKSLIDWSKWKPDIDAAMKAMKELKASIKSIGTEVAKLLNIDLKNWTLKGDIENLTKQFGEFGKMMSMIGDLINALKDGNWKQAYSIGQQLMAQGRDEPDAMPAVTESAENTRKWVIEQWHKLTGTGEPEQHAQSANSSGSGKAIADRNNNPGNLRPVNGKGFTSHKTPLDGWMAMARQIRLYFTGKSAAAGYKKLETIWDIIHKYAPVEDNNDPQAYSKFVAKMMGVGVKDKLNLSDPQQFSNLLQAMSRKEGYSSWNSPLAGVAASKASAQIQQQNTYNIYGGNAQEIGGEVESRQLNANAKAMRTNQVRTG